MRKYCWVHRSLVVRSRICALAGKEGSELRFPQGMPLPGILLSHTLRSCQQDPGEAGRGWNGRVWGWDGHGKTRWNCFQAKEAPGNCALLFIG